MGRKVCFIGHRFLLPSNIQLFLKTAIESEIKQGCKNFIVGSHGDFDREALDTCLSLRNIYPDIKIEVAVTSFNQTYTNVETVMFEIENLHYKQRIMASNKQMIDSCDTLICYVKPNSWNSGAKMVMDYAIKQGLKIINLYDDNYATL